MILYYNPECTKCKHALSLLENQNCEVYLRNYLQKPPNAGELKELLKKLGCTAEELVRKSEELYLEKFSSKSYTEEEWIDILAANPILIERPILIEGDKAIIGRPPMLVLNLLK